MLPALSYVTISCALILEIFMEISTGLEGENICRNPITNLSRCCKDYEEKLNKCVECRAGYFGLNCSSKCPENYYGRHCSERCDCPEHYSCDHVCGCEQNTTLLNHTKSERCNRSIKNHENVTEYLAFEWIPIFFIVVGIIVCLLGVNILCWRCVLQKGQSTYKFNGGSQDDTKLVRYHFNNEEYTGIQREKEGPNANQTNIDFNLDDLAAFEEINKHSNPKQILRGKNFDNFFPMGGVGRNVEKSLRTEGNEPPGSHIQPINSDLLRAPENTGYLSAEVNFTKKISSGSDSDSYQSVKSKHYLNEHGGHPTETMGLYESVTDGRNTHEHHYADLQPSKS